jgi:predicted nucleotidyltransferase component of viral defense system
VIPHMNIIAWSNVAPWAEPRQIEQDLIISRAVIDIFNDEFLHEELRFRGGTALNKLHFPAPLRYSEDIDLVRTSGGPIGPVLDRLRDVLEWLGHANYDPSPVAPSLIFRADAEGGGPQLRLKVEINTREREAYGGPVAMTHAVENPWFTGQADIATFTNEEMLATKLRALLERNKGRDLFDLAHALSSFSDLDTAGVVALFLRYLEAQEKTLSRAQAEQRMLAKLVDPGFLSDIRPLLSAQDADALNDESMYAAFMDVFNVLIARIPGNPWARTDDMKERFGL